MPAGNHFNTKAFLSTAGVGRTMVSFRKGEAIYAQGGASDALFVIQAGQVRVSIRSQSGKETTLAILGEGDFLGKDSVAGLPVRMASASALTACRLLRIGKKAMLLGLKRQVKLANVFWAYVLARNIRYQQDLVDQHCSLSEKRLAHILVKLAHLDTDDANEVAISKVGHEILSEMVGTTRSRICFFMRRFREAGFIDYAPGNRLMCVHRTLLAFSTQ